MAGLTSRARRAITLPGGFEMKSSMRGVWVVAAFAAAAAAVPGAQAREAAQPVPDLPTAIRCTSESVNPSVREFVIQELNTTLPSLPGLDATSPFPNLRAGGVLSLDMQNGCDNLFTILFYVEDLQALRNHRRPAVSALMRFVNSESQCIEGDLDCDLETIPLRCTLEETPVSEMMEDLS